MLYGITRDDRRSPQQPECGGCKSKDTTQSPSSLSPATTYRMPHTAQYTALDSTQPRPSSENISCDTHTSISSTDAFVRSRTQGYDSDSDSSTSSVPLLSRGCEPLPRCMPALRKDGSQNQVSRHNGLPSQNNRPLSIRKNRHSDRQNNQQALEMTVDLSLFAPKSDNSSSSDSKDKSDGHIIISSVNNPNEENSSVAPTTYQDPKYHRTWFGDNEPVSKFGGGSESHEILGRGTDTNSTFSVTPLTVRQQHEGTHHDRRGSSDINKNEANSSTAPQPNSRRSSSIASTVLNVYRPSHSEQNLSSHSIGARRVDRSTQTDDEFESSEATQSINHDHHNEDNDNDNQYDDDAENDAAVSITSTDPIIAELDEVIQNPSLSPNLRGRFISLADRLLQMNIKLFHPLRSAREPKLVIRESDANAVVDSTVEMGTYLSRLDAKICDWLEACDEARGKLEVISASVDGGNGSPSAADLEMTYHRMAQVVVRLLRKPRPLERRLLVVFQELYDVYIYDSFRRIHGRQTVVGDDDLQPVALPINLATPLAALRGVINDVVSNYAELVGMMAEIRQRFFVPIERKLPRVAEGIWVMEE